MMCAREEERVPEKEICCELADAGERLDARGGETQTSTGQTSAAKPDGIVRNVPRASR